MSPTEPSIALTDHESEILKASLGMSDAQIAEATGLARQTIKNVRFIAYKKLGITRRGHRAMLVEAAEKMGWITFEVEEG